MQCTRIRPLDTTTSVTQETDGRQQSHSLTPSQKGRKPSFGENYEGGFVLMLEPGFLSKLHLTVLEAEGVLFNVLLFLRFCVSEVKSLIKLVRRRAKHPPD